MDGATGLAETQFQRTYVIRRKSVQQSAPPVSAPTHRFGQLGSVKNAARGMRYVWVNKGDDDTYVRYIDLRYRPVRWAFQRAAAGDPGVRVKDGYAVDDNGNKIPTNAFGGAYRGTETEGQQVEKQGNVLMEIRLSAYEEIVQHGAPEVDGTEGQDGADRLEKHLIRIRSVKDAMRGIHGGVSLHTDKSDGRRHGEAEEVHV